MPTTPKYALRYPASTDPPAGHTQIGNLATDVENLIDGLPIAELEHQDPGEILIANAAGVVTGTLITGDATVTSSGLLRLTAAVAGAGLVGGAGAPLDVNPGSGLEISADALRIAAALAGAGLSGGGGSALAVNVDGTSIEINTDTLRVAAALAGAGLTGGGGSPLAVNPDGASLEVVSDQVRAKASGITEAHLNPTVAGLNLDGGAGAPLDVNMTTLAATATATGTLTGTWQAIASIASVPAGKYLMLGSYGARNGSANGEARARFNYPGGPSADSGAVTTPTSGLANPRAERIITTNALGTVSVEGMIDSGTATYGGTDPISVLSLIRLG